MATRTNSDMVFVTLDIMLGDGDGKIEGHKILPKDKWEAEVAVFENFLKTKETTTVEGDSVWGCFEMSMENYEVKPCTQEEAKTIRKFFTSESMRMPTEFLEQSSLDYDGPVWGD